MSHRAVLAIELLKLLFKKSKLWLAKLLPFECFSLLGCRFLVISLLSFFGY